MRKNNDVSSQAVGDEVLILDKQQNQIHQLNTVASYIWHKLEPPFSTNTIVQALANDFEVEECAARQDVERIIDEFLQCGLLVN